MKKIIVVVLTLALISCGGGDGSGGSSDSGNENSGRERNVAALENGATVTATYDIDGALNIIDGDTNTSNYWAANISMDSITIDFGSVVMLSDITIYTNGMMFTNDLPDKIIEVSEDGDTWYITALPIGNDIPCLNSNNDYGQISCEFKSDEPVRYIKITIIDSTSPESIEIYEVVATGT